MDGTTSFGKLINIKGKTGSRAETRKTLRIQIILITGFLLFWEFASGRLIDTFWIGSPSRVAKIIYDMAVSGILFVHIRVTIIEMILGLVLGILIGTFLGLLLGINRLASQVFEPFIQAIYSIPKIALAPLFVLWLGIGLESKVTLTATIVFFLVFWTTFFGVINVDRDLINVVRVMGASRFFIIRKVIIPSAVASMFNGVRLAVPQSLVGAVMGEMIASNRGVGFMIQYASSQFNTSGVFAGLLILMVLGVILDSIAKFLQDRSLRWKPVDNGL